MFIYYRRFNYIDVRGRDMENRLVPGLLADEVQEKYETMPDFPVLTFENEQYDDEVITYKDIYLKSLRLAKRLEDLGFKKGDRFAIIMRNHPEFVYALVAASMTGTVAVPIDPRANEERLMFQIKNSQSVGIVFSNEFYEKVVFALTSLKNVKVIGIVYKDGFKEPIRKGYTNLNSLLDKNEIIELSNRNKEINIPLEVIYTSGTTGDPKGVVIKGDRLYAFKLLAQLIWQYSLKDKLYTGLSLTHGNAQAVTMVPALTLGIPAVISRKFTKSRIWDICRYYGCTTFSLLGGMMMGIYSEPKKPMDKHNPVRVVLSAGTPKAIWREFEERFDVKIHEWYGAVEGGFAHNPPGVGPVGSFGKPPEGFMEMMVVREDGTPCEPYEIGEIVCRPVGGKAEVEYLNNPEASKKKTKGGWLRTGDMGHIDENGWFYFDFRKGGGLRRQGEFIQPEYIEKILAEIEEIEDVCVYGIPAETGAPGEVDLVAAITIFEGYTFDAKKIFNELKKHLENNQIPSYIQVVEEIPKSASQKNLYRLLKETFSKDAENVYSYTTYGKN